jgi:long-subunit acyl-CoA synthetase (AMP-forming)
VPQKKLNMLLAIPIASYLIKSKIKKSLGLDKADVMLTGAAPMSPELMLWFQKIGVPIREAYGMSENFNVCAMNPKNQIRIGSVGKLFDNQEVVIDPETQEIKQRCGWVMKGYYKDLEQTAITLRDGFLHTGDMGELSSDGFLKLTGRVKDIFKTTKGVYIAPGKIELQFLSLPAIDQACVLGMKYPQPFVVAVLSEMGRVMKKEELTDLLESMLMAYNQNCMEYQKLNKVIIVKDEWTIDNGLLTPTFKMKRNSLAAKYEAAFGTIYNLDEKVCWE